MYPQKFAGSLQLLRNEAVDLRDCLNMCWVHFDILAMECIPSCAWLAFSLSCDCLNYAPSDDSMNFLYDYDFTIMSEGVVFIWLCVCVDRGMVFGVGCLVYSHRHTPVDLKVLIVLLIAGEDFHWRNSLHLQQVRNTFNPLLRCVCS